jgi:hypothetical protein
MQKFLHILKEQTQKKKLLPKNKFKMATKFKMTTKTKFTCKKLQNLFFQKKNQGFFSFFSKIQNGAYIQHGYFFGIFF